MTDVLRSSLVLVGLSFLAGCSGNVVGDTGQTAAPPAAGGTTSVGAGGSVQAAEGGHAGLAGAAGGAGMDALGGAPGGGASGSAGTANTAGMSSVGGNGSGGASGASSGAGGIGGDTTCVPTSPPHAAWAIPLGESTSILSIVTSATDVFVLANVANGTGPFSFDCPVVGAVNPTAGATVVADFDAMGTCKWARYVASEDDATPWMAVTATGDLILQASHGEKDEPYLADCPQPEGPIPYDDVASWLVRVQQDGTCAWGLYLGGIGYAQPILGPTSAFSPATNIVVDLHSGAKLLPPSAALSGVEYFVQSSADFWGIKVLGLNQGGDFMCTGVGFVHGRTADWTLDPELDLSFAVPKPFLSTSAPVAAMRTDGTLLALLVTESGIPTLSVPDAAPGTSSLIAIEVPVSGGPPSVVASLPASVNQPGSDYATAMSYPPFPLADTTWLAENPNTSTDPVTTFVRVDSSGSAQMQWNDLYMDVPLFALDDQAVAFGWSGDSMGQTFAALRQLGACGWTQKIDVSNPALALSPLALTSQGKGVIAAVHLGESQPCTPGTATWAGTVLSTTTCSETWLVRLDP